MISAGFNVNDCGPKDAAEAYINECREAFEARDAVCESFREDDAMYADECVKDSTILAPDSEFKKAMGKVDVFDSTLALMKEAVESTTWGGSDKPLGGAAAPAPADTPPADTPPAAVDFTSDIAAVCKDDADCTGALTKVAEAAMAKHKDAEKVKSDYIVASQDFASDDVYSTAGISKPEYALIVLAQGSTPPADESDKKEKGIADKWIEFGLRGGYISAGMKNELNDFEGVPGSEQPLNSKWKGAMISPYVDLFLVGMFNKGYSINGFNAGLGAGYCWIQMEDFERSNGTDVSTDDSHCLDVHGVAEYAFHPKVSAQLRLGLNYSFNKVMMGPEGATKQNIPAFMGELGINVSPVNHLLLGISGVLVAGNTELKGETISDDNLSERPLGSNTSVLGGGILFKVGGYF